MTTKPESPPPVPADLRLALPKPGAVERDHAERLLGAVVRGVETNEGRYAKKSGLNFTYLTYAESNGRRIEIAVKQTVARPGAINRLRFRSTWRRSLRQWRGARRLGAIGVPVAKPMLLARCGIEGQPCDWLILERVPGKDLLRHLRDGDLTISEQHDAARRVGRIVNAIDSYGWFNRDTKLSNMIRTPAGEIVLVDTVDIRRQPGRRPLMLAAMLFEALDAGAPPRRTLMMRCLKSAVEEPRETWRALAKAAARRRQSPGAGAAKT